MADSPRTLAALKALFADNSSGAISPQDLRDFLVSVLGDYACIFVHAAATAQSFTTAPSKVTLFTTDGPAKGVAAQAASDQLVIDTAGDYEVSFQASFSGDNNATFAFHLRVGGVAQPLGCHRKLSTNGDVGSSSFICIVTLAAGAVLTVYGESDDGGGKNVTFVDAQFTARRVS